MNKNISVSFLLLAVCYVASAFPPSYSQSRTTSSSEHLPFMAIENHDRLALSTNIDNHLSSNTLDFHRNMLNGNSGLFSDAAERHFEESRRTHQTISNKINESESKPTHSTSKFSSGK